MATKYNHINLKDLKDPDLSFKPDIGQILTDYRNKSGKLFGQLKNAINRNDWEEIGDFANQFQAVTKLVGASKANDMLWSVEQEAYGDQNMHEVKSTLDNLEKELESIREEVEKELSQHTW